MARPRDRRQAGPDRARQRRHRGAAGPREPAPRARAQRRQAVELGRLGVEIEALYGMPMDIEWALADGAFAICRPGRSPRCRRSRQRRTRAAHEWPLPDPKGPVRARQHRRPDARPGQPLFTTLGFEPSAPGMSATIVRLIGSSRPVAGQLFDRSTAMSTRTCS